MMEWLYILDLMGEILPDIIPEGMDPGLVGLVSGIDSELPLDLSPIIESLDNIQASLEYAFKDDLDHAGLISTVRATVEGVATAIDTHSQTFQVWDPVNEEMTPVLPLLLEELSNIETGEGILEIGGNAIYLKSKVVRS
jgi:hypothetical protein